MSDEPKSSKRLTEQTRLDLPLANRSTTPHQNELDEFRHATSGALKQQLAVYERQPYRHRASEMLHPAPSAIQLATPCSGLEPGPLRARAHSTSAGGPLARPPHPAATYRQHGGRPHAGINSPLATSDQQQQQHHQRSSQSPAGGSGALYAAEYRSAPLQGQLTPRLLASDHFLFQANQRLSSARLSASDQRIESSAPPSPRCAAAAAERAPETDVGPQDRAAPAEKSAGQSDERRADASPTHRRGRRASSARPAATGCEGLNLQALELFKKRSFACTILGAHQTGKRSIVLCFVKLLNEFKLAVDEFRREKIITKLVECSEKLQELAKRREQEQHEEQRRREQRRTSRLNSWLPSAAADTVKGLLSLSPGSKKRLHSMAGPFLTVPAGDQSGGRGQQPDVDELATAAGQQPGNSIRRHTTIEPPTFRLISGCDSARRPEGIGGADAAATRTAATLESKRLDKFDCQQLLRQRHSKLAGQCNKSDSNISYETSSSTCWPAPERNSADDQAATCSSFQLQVPSWDSVNSAARKCSEPSAMTGDSAFERDDKSDTPASAPRRGRRHTSNASTVGFSPAADEALTRRRRSQASQAEAPDSPTRRRPSSKSIGSVASRPTRRHSIRMSRRRRRILLSLKELNRRKFAIKFSTRRQISDLLVERKRHIEHAQQADPSRLGRRKSTIIQLTGRLGSGQDAGGDSDRARFAPLPDAYIVVYSINDRDSFDYAKSMIAQLRSISQLIQQDVPLPIVLVANKSDLERNRQVKSDDGRAVAKRYSCKFIEISCTIGFNLDNLLVGLRTQLVLKHHVLLNSVLRPGFRQNQAHKPGPAAGENRDAGPAAGGGAQARKERNSTKESDNILVRFYKRYVMDCRECDYDCDNFSKL